MISKIVFPRQFEFKISWNATIGNQSSANNTNYIIAAVQVDGTANRIRVQTNFSTLSLQAQEFLSVMIDLGQRRVSLKQKESCKEYLLKLSMSGGKYKDEKLPNVADLFELWPYLMYFNETKNAKATNGLLEFMYSYPLGEKRAKDSDIIVYFDKETLEIRKFLIRANSLNITN